MSTGKGTVLVLDDDASLCRSLARLLKAKGYQHRTFCDPQDLLSSPPVHGPACLILDLRLGKEDGLHCLRQFNKNGHCYPVIFLTAYGDLATVVQAMRDGADDFLEKPYDPEVLIAAVSHALERSRRQGAQEAELSKLRACATQLTPRERQVIGFVTRGFLNKEIARELGLAEITIKIHRARAMRKIGARNAVELARKAALLNLAIPPPDSAPPNKTPGPHSIPKRPS
jgi:FixJ family two-component response regulator